MSCANMTALLHGMLDGELDLVNAMHFEEHIRQCPTCAEEYREQQALRAAVRRVAKHRAPDDLRRRVESAIHASAPPARSPARWWQRSIANWQWAMGVGVALAASLLLFIAMPATQEDLPHELIASHVRSRLADHLTDVATSDQHTVKPWFSSKLDYSPPVTDLSKEGFPLVGGRLDYIHDRVVAALVYKRREHVINLFVWPTPGAADTMPQTSSREGFHVRSWTSAGMTFAAVSDLNPAELAAFERVFRATAG